MVPIGCTQFILTGLSVSQSVCIILGHMVVSERAHHHGVLLFRGILRDF